MIKRDFYEHEIGVRLHTGWLFSVLENPCVIHVLALSDDLFGFVEVRKLFFPCASRHALRSRARPWYPDGD